MSASRLRRSRAARTPPGQLQSTEPESPVAEMWPFSSSSNTADSSSPASGPSTSGAPNREQRAVCWKARDDYFDCLIRNKVMVPGEEGEGVCKIEIGEYEKNCGKTWVSA